jgi:hypothetical protein
MNLYAGLFDSMLDCCGRTWLRHGPIYTVATMALALAVSLNILSIIDLLWILGVLDNPYQSAGQLHPQRYVLQLLALVFIVNAILARRHFSTDHFCLEQASGQTRLAQDAQSAARRVAPAYVLGSAALFLSTLSIDMMVA